MFRAFSDPTRVRILALLARGERCVGDLTSVLDVPQPTASRHLAYLRKAGLVRTRKAGLWNYYRLAPARTAFHRKLLACLAACAAEASDLKRDARRLAGLDRSGACCPG
jgi:ArsR family transcriptional regulator, arsenate/arsenite/antimonite-responsive transcriptional repressor